MIFFFITQQYKSELLNLTQSSNTSLYTHLLEIYWQPYEPRDSDNKRYFNSHFLKTLFFLLVDVKKIANTIHLAL